MPRHLHLDFESFSEINLPDVGCYRYSFDPSTEILIAGMALDDGEPVAWDCTMEPWEVEFTCGEHMAALQDPEVLIYAHNAMMESSVCQALLMKTWGIPAPDISRFRCTMSLARRASLPGKLEKLAEVLGLKNLKDNRGKALIKKFSMLQPAKKPTKKYPEGLPVRRIRPQDEPEAFKEFIEYCLQDVRTEQEVSRKLRYFDEPINNRNYVLDQRINARGVPVNLEALRHAQKLIDEETEIVSAQFRELTGFEVTQRDVFLKWLHEQGCHLDDLQAETIETFLDEIEGGDATCPHNAESAEQSTCPVTAPVGCNGEPKFDPSVSLAITALRLKQSIAYASIKKVQTMLDCAGPHDNRIRGMLNHHGATTGRWTASLVQFQNMKRPADHMAEKVNGSKITWSEMAYREICEGVSREMLELCYGPVLEVISSCIRHFVHDVKLEEAA